MTRPPETSRLNSVIDYCIRRLNFYAAKTPELNSIISDDIYWIESNRRPPQIANDEEAQARELHDAFHGPRQEIVAGTEFESDDGERPCCHPGGHEFHYTGTAYGGDDPSFSGEGRCFCIHCGADGDA